jgi:hypothetical protein
MRYFCAVKTQIDQKEFLTQYFDLTILFYSVFCLKKELFRAVTLI